MRRIGDIVLVNNAGRVSTQPAASPDPRVSAIAFIGNIGKSHSSPNGQTVRTRLTLAELQLRFGLERIVPIDTSSVSRSFTTARSIIRAARTASDWVVLPGARHLTVMGPIYAHLARKGVRIHCLAVGGWLPQLLAEKPALLSSISDFCTISVQTQRMHSELASMGLTNVSVTPNYRSFPLTRKVSHSVHDPIRLVFLSRIRPDKGVAIAAEAVHAINAKAGSARVSLDIWGPVKTHDMKWFTQLQKSFDTSIRYRGSLKPEEVHSALVEYDCMVFPTFYRGEGFPGVILDAYIAGIPVLASDWKDNAEFITLGESGLVFPAKNHAALQGVLDMLVNEPKRITTMKRHAAKAAESYHVDSVMTEWLLRTGLYRAL